MQILAYMVKVYVFLVKARRRTIESLPDHYQVPVAEYLAQQIEG
ncbi:MAG: CD1375 family protein [Bacillota bacterium]